jgi:Mrp family chromosome partitioning ATPase
MVDLTAETTELWAALGKPTPGRGRVIQLVGARTGVGTSTVARELAFTASRRPGASVWLVDLDVLTSPQYGALTAEPERYGVLGPPAAATPDGSSFLTVQPPVAGPDGRTAPDSSFLAAYQVGDARWWTTRFLRTQMCGGQGVHILPRHDYWDGLRRHADLIIVDCPAAAQSKAALTIAPAMDQTIIVVAADDPDVRGPAALRDSLSAAGAQVAGLFLNRATVEAPAFMKALLP